MFRVGTLLKSKIIQSPIDFDACKVFENQKL